MVDRYKTMQSWLTSLGYEVGSLKVVSADASFRRYFRINKNAQSFIVMDAPPENESCDSFISLAQSLTSHKVNAPQIFEQNLKDGFLVLSDFGDDLLLGILNQDSVNDLYSAATDALFHMQNDMPLDQLNGYTAELLDSEMELFREWFLAKLLGIELNSDQKDIWNKTKQTLVESALAQPQVFVHRDFHSRNLIKTAQGDIGIIDFQDAVKGPITYDLVSLLRDCYIAWPNQQVEKWVVQYYTRAKEQWGVEVSAETFMQWFNLMGVQRHLKAVGIFSRLKLRDGKDGYIADIPTTLNYIKQVSMNEPGISVLSQLIDELDLQADINAHMGT